MDRTKPDTTTPAGATRETKPTVEQAAVIDIGTNSIRMSIAEIDNTGRVRTLENLSQEVHLGKDTFTKGYIRKGTIEECVRVLKSYRSRLSEYGITNDDRIRVVATSAVREAENRLTFADRIYIATGFQVDPIDPAEVNRITYLGIRPHLEAQPELAAAKTVIIEVGGGSTELLLVQRGEVIHSHTYRLGALRLQEMLEEFRAPTGKMRNIMEGQIRIVTEQVVQHVAEHLPVQMVAIGGDVRFAASELLDNWDPNKIASVPVAELERFADKMLKLTVDKIVHDYHLTFPEAETVAPALLAYVALAKALQCREILVTTVNLRDGLLKQMAAKESFDEDFNRQIIRSAMELARRFDIDEPHAEHVADLTQALFKALQAEHQLDAHYALILYLAALLHEVGLYVSTSSHHKHSMYLIVNSDLFGLSKRDVLLVALVARYCRRASPKPTHQGYSTLDRERRIAVAKMAAILRVADALDHSHSQRVGEIRCSCEPDRLIISVPNVDDLSVEQLALNQKGPLFEEVFGMEVLLRTVGP